MVSIKKSKLSQSNVHLILNDDSLVCLRLNDVTMLFTAETRSC